ncbi:protein of unknown function [Micropruina glycogenica]|uniref:Uncharacterized protein n=1 Tax=Micropruina glycogenica TaxID=75385 RepID=A0A2N9JLD4_9ACTN|nr:protein of unknown function [Micropruina glycogenica]
MHFADAPSKLLYRERRQLVDVSWGWVDGFGPSIGVALVMSAYGIVASGRTVNFPDRTLVV